MARPSGWDILGLDGDPTPGVVESVQTLAKEFGDFAHDVESAYHSLNSFGGDATALQWVGQTADAFKSSFGPLPGRLQKLYTSYSEASDALSAYAPKLQAAQSKADAALRQAQDAHADLQRATTTANNAATDLKTAQQNQTAAPNPQAVTDAQTAHDAAQKNLDAAKGKLTALTAQAKQAYDDRIAAAKECAKALHHAQSDGIHNKHWWEHVGEALSEWGGKIAEIANDLAPFLDVLALATSWIPGVDVVTAGLAEADNLIALAGTGLEIAGDGMQGHWGDALMGAGMLGATFLGGKALGSLGGKVLSKFGKEAEDTVGSEARTAEDAAEENVGADALEAGGHTEVTPAADPVDVVSGQMITTKTDLILPGILPVLLRRAYSSGYATGRLFGPGWSSTLDQRLSVNDAGIHFAGDVGQTLHYPIPAPGDEVAPVRGANWPLTWNRETDEILITDPSTGHVRHFPTVHYGDDQGSIRDLTAITDRNGNRIDVLRDHQGTPTGLEHAGYRLAIETTPTMRGVRVTAVRLLEAGRDASHDISIKKYEYDDHGRLVAVIDSSGQPYRYEYDDRGQITAWTNRVGYRYAYEYDLRGRVTRGVGDGGFMSASFSYAADGRSTSVTNSLGSTTTYHYNDHGKITRTVDPLGGTTHQEWDAHDRLIARTDALGRTTRLTLDERGNATCVTRPDGTTIEIEYNNFGQPVLERLPDGAVWRLEFDDRGNQTAAIDPTGAVTRYVHTDSGAVCRVTDPLGNASSVETNPAGLPVAVTDAAGGRAQAIRDPLGRIIETVDPSGAVNRTAWNVEGLKLWQSAPDGTRTEWTYDAEGNPTSCVTPSGATTSWTYGAFGMVTERVEADGGRFAFGYDSELCLRTVTNGSGASWTYAYDAASRLESESDFSGRTRHYDLDLTGQLVGITAAGRRTELSRDAMGRVVRRTTDDGEYRYEFDPMGRLASSTSPSSSLSYKRDGAGRTIAETVDGRTIEYTLDEAGNLVGRRTPNGSETHWSYDAAGFAAELRTSAGRLEFRRDVARREISRVFNEDIRLEQRYDQVGRLIEQNVLAADASAGDSASQPAALIQRSYTYQADGELTKIDDSLRGTRHLLTDSSGRIRSVSAASWREDYTYDAFGNVTDAATSWSPDSSGSRRTENAVVRTAGRNHYDYDGFGRIVRSLRRGLSGQRIETRFVWNADDRLVEVALPDGSIWRYTYDPSGRRSGKYQVNPDGSAGKRIVFSWQGAQLVEQVSYHADETAEALVFDYEPGSWQPIAQSRRSWSDSRPQDEIDEAFYAIVSDLSGAPSEVIDAEGRVVWYMTTSLFGQQIDVSAQSGIDCPLRFPGQYRDDETGLHYNYHRYYDPTLAAYLTSDPLGLAPAPNNYAYVPNPLTWIDPLGLSGYPGEGAPTSEWVPDENYSDAAINARVAGNADTKAYFETPNDIHDLVNDVVSDPNYPIRLKPNGSPDLYEARGGIRGTLKWKGTQIFSPDGDYTSQVRILVDQNTGEIAYVGRKADGGHNYNQIIPYPWARRP
jgi:RHS repeat-associated protein